MVQGTTQSQQLPFIEDRNIKEVFADTCAGVNINNGNAHLAFVSIMPDYTSNPASSQRIVSARMVLPISGMMELRDLLSQVIGELTSQGIIRTAPTPSPNAVTSG